MSFEILFDRGPLGVYLLKSPKADILVERQALLCEELFGRLFFVAKKLPGAADGIRQQRDEIVVVHVFLLLDGVESEEHPFGVRLSILLLNLSIDKGGCSG